MSFSFPIPALRRLSLYTSGPKPVISAGMPKSRPWTVTLHSHKTQQTNRNIQWRNIPASTSLPAAASEHFTLELLPISFNGYGNIEMILWKDLRKVIKFILWSGMNSMETWKVPFFGKKRSRNGNAMPRLR